MKNRKVHWDKMGEAACNIEHQGRLRLTDDPERVSCGLCQRTLHALRLDALEDARKSEGIVLDTPPLEELDFGSTG